MKTPESAAAGETVTTKTVPERLREACIGHPAAKIPWPHRLLHEAADEIDRLKLTTDHKVSRTYGELPFLVQEMIESHRWDNMNISEQRDWALNALTDERWAKAQLARFERRAGEESK